MSRRCLACGKRPAATLADWPALCRSCLNRTGERIKLGARVICEVDDNCSGRVERIVDDFAVVRTASGQEAWVPFPELVVALHN